MHSYVVDNIHWSAHIEQQAMNFRPALPDTSPGYYIPHYSLKYVSFFQWVTTLLYLNQKHSTRGLYLQDRETKAFTYSPG